MDPFDETINTYNKVAELYQQKFMSQQLYNESYDYVCDLLNVGSGNRREKNTNILDVGCGPGNITQYLKSKHPDFQITGVDAAENMIALAKVNNPDSEFLLMDIRKLNSFENKFNAIVCGFCLPYLSSAEMRTFITDCKRLLGSNGVLYLSFVEGSEEQSGFMTGNGGDRVYFNYHQLGVVRNTLEMNGFQEVKLFHLPFPKGDNQIEVHTVSISIKKED